MACDLLPSPRSSFVVVLLPLPFLTSGASGVCFATKTNKCGFVSSAAIVHFVRCVFVFVRSTRASRWSSQGWACSSSAFQVRSGRDRVLGVLGLVVVLDYNFRCFELIIRFVMGSLGAPQQTNGWSGLDGDLGSRSWSGWLFVCSLPLACVPLTAHTLGPRQQHQRARDRATPPLGPDGAERACKRVRWEHKSAVRERSRLCSSVRAAAGRGNGELNCAQRTFREQTHAGRRQAWLEPRGGPARTHTLFTLSNGDAACRRGGMTKREKSSFATVCVCVCVCVYVGRLPVRLRPRWPARSGGRGGGTGGLRNCSPLWVSLCRARRHPPLPTRILFLACLKFELGQPRRPPIQCRVNTHAQVAGPGPLHMRRRDFSGSPGRRYAPAAAKLNLPPAQMRARVTFRPAAHGEGERESASSEPVREGGGPAASSFIVFRPRALSGPCAPSPLLCSVPPPRVGSFSPRVRELAGTREPPLCAARLCTQTLRRARTHTHTQTVSPTLATQRAARMPILSPPRPYATSALATTRRERANTRAHSLHLRLPPARPHRPSVCGASHSPPCSRLELRARQVSADRPSIKRNAPSEFAISGRSRRAVARDWPEWSELRGGLSGYATAGPGPTNGPAVVRYCRRTSVSTSPVVLEIPAGRTRREGRERVRRTRVSHSGKPERDSPPHSARKHSAEQSGEKMNAHANAQRPLASSARARLSGACLARPRTLMVERVCVLSPPHHAHRRLQAGGQAGRRARRQVPSSFAHSRPAAGK
ncbi:Hypothetical predicted protein [Olea europaea subsp. europaea]|uniref:Uncharacterized protein n=1 Tax=Olea europaea subsp. europaea TaxID=158383 RepID=A0A8S0RAQ2_OLEEU|nr:Hypothetical predicted protein [Olea europaea subsp. europaea]